MKKSLAVMLLLVLLSCGGLAAAHITLSRSASAVELTETHHLGDPETVRDLELQVNCTEGHQLFWETALVPGQSAETRFSFFPRPQYVQGNGKHYALDINLLSGGSMYSGTPIDFDQPNPYSFDPVSYLPLFEDVSQRTKPGTIHSEVLHLRDWMETYPLDIYVDCPGDPHHSRWSEADAHQNYTDPEQARIAKAWASFFKSLQQTFSFPVTEDYCVLIEVSMDENGDIYELNCQDCGPDVRAPADVPYGDVLNTNVPSSPVSIYTSTIQTDNWLYFLPVARTQDGQLLDYSLTPGYGLYRLPLFEEVPSIDDLELVLPLQPDQLAGRLSLDSSGKRILLEIDTGENGSTLLLDPETGVLRQTLELGRQVYDDGDWTHLINNDDLLMVVQNHNEQKTFHFYQQDAAGQYQYQFDGSFLTSQDAYRYAGTGQMTLQYNGERLALISSSYWNYEPNTQNCSAHLMVWDQTGLLYAGIYQNSLDRSTGRQGPRINEELPPSLHFLPPAA